MTPALDRLMADLREIIDNAEYEEGSVYIPALDVERLERSIHAVDKTFLPTRADSAVDPCPHNCEYCRRTGR